MAEDCRGVFTVKPPVTPAEEKQERRTTTRTSTVWVKSVRKR